MELILKKPMEELVPAVIAWNNEELLAEAKRLVASYENKVYTEESYAEAKSDSARINTVINALTAARIQVDKNYKEPLERFDASIKEVVSVFERARNNAKGFVDGCDEARKREKAEELKDYWERCSAELGAVVEYDKIYNSRWLNATFTIFNAQMEINDKITKIRSDILSIEAMKSEDEAVLKTMYFKTLDLGAAIRENEEMRAAKQRVIDLKKAKEQASAEVIKASVEVAQAEVKKDVSEPIKTKIESEKQYTVKFSVMATKEKLAILSRFLRDNSITYQSI